MRDVIPTDPMSRKCAGHVTEEAAAEEVVAAEAAEAVTIRRAVPITRPRKSALTVISTGLQLPIGALFRPKVREN